MLVSEFLEHSAERFPDKVALVCGGQRLSYVQLESFANSFSSALREQGFRRQDRGVIYLDNSVESVVSLFGILKCGGIFVVINPQVKAGKLEYILDDCQARVLVTDVKHFNEVREVITNRKDLLTVILTGDDRLKDSSGGTQELCFYRDIVEESPSGHVSSPCIDIDLAGLIYTSGSTGNPKGVMLTHLNMVSAASSIIQYLENTSDDIVLNVLPLSFDYGLYQVLMAFKFGGTVVLEKTFVYPQHILGILDRENVTGWPIVPTIVAILLRLKNLESYDFPCLRYITNTAQALPPRYTARLREVFPKVKIYSMYGLTECKRVSYLPPEELDRRPTSVGKAMPNTEVYLVDEDGQVITEPKRPGELVVRGSNVMKGYWNLPEETASVLRPGIYPGESVLYTGDLFEKDEEGYLYFLGRKDDIIKTAGERVSPKEVENAICEIDDVLEAAVIGVDDDVLGQAIKAFVVLKDASPLTEKDIIRLCSRTLESFMVPKYVSFVNELPKTATGKIQKRSLV